MSVKLELKEPIKALCARHPDQDTVKELEFDEPKGVHLRKIGMPFNMAEGSIQIDGEKVAKYIEKLSKLAAGSADELSASDFIAAQNIVMRFFGESQS